MFFVTEKGKIYLNQFDSKLQVYREVHLEPTGEIKALVTGVKKKPAKRDLYTLNELKAAYLSI